MNFKKVRAIITKKNGCVKSESIDDCTRSVIKCIQTHRQKTDQKTDKKKRGYDVSGNREGKSSGKHKGIRLSYLNVLLVFVGLVIAVLMVVSTYQTTGTVQKIVSVTDDYLYNQQTGGMMRDFSESLGALAEDFVRNGSIGAANEYAGKMSVISAQLAQYAPESSVSSEANQALQTADEAFRMRNDTEIRAMRLAADKLPTPAFEQLPEMLKKTELSEEDKALSPEEKDRLAAELLAAEEYTAAGETIRKEVDNSHRLSSEAATKQSGETSSRVNSIVTWQKILVYVFIALSIVALILNWLLIISPIRKSVGNLDRREAIPEKGSYEMRHLAKVYNDVLADNEEKKKALSYTASHDALTDTLNRASFDRAYQEAESGQVAILIADVDHFKQYNDEYGHDVGDKVLQMATEALKRHFHSGDQICRIGGDEFCVIMPGICQSRAESIRDRIFRINEELKQEGAGLPPVTLSAGIACWDRPNPKGSIFKDADSVLLELKKTRDTCCAVYKG